MFFSNPGKVDNNTSTYDNNYTTVETRNKCTYLMQ